MKNVLETFDYIRSLAQKRRGTFAMSGEPEIHQSGVKRSIAARAQSIPRLST